MARKRDPQQLLERARQMEAEARRIREEADQIRKEREAREDRKAGVLLRRYWKTGWTGVDLQEVITAAGEVFGEPPVKHAGVPPSGDPGGEHNAERPGAERSARDGPAEIPGGLLEAVAEGTDDGA